MSSNDKLPSRYNYTIIIHTKSCIPKNIGIIKKQTYQSQHHLPLVNRSILLQLLLRNLPKLIVTSSSPSDSSLRNFQSPRDSISLLERISSSNSLNLNNSNSRILWSTIMNSISEVADPGFKGWCVVGANFFAVAFNCGEAGDGGPFTLLSRPYQYKFPGV
jgi:hypothetical protein